MQKIKKLISEVTNSRTYKRANFKIVCSCPRCSPHRGCNRLRVKRQRNWKKFRKTKYK